MLIKYLKSIGITILVLLISTLIMTILNYFNIIGNSFLSVLKIIIPIVCMFIGGFLVGKESKEKGYIEGIKIGITLILLLIIINLIFIKSKFNFTMIIFYVISLASSVLGSMIGINKKKLEEK